jgi:hypothetical protein
MTGHLKLATIFEHAAGTGVGPITNRRPMLSLVWSLDPQTGKPVARWVAALHEPSNMHEVIAVQESAVAAQSG